MSCLRVRVTLLAVLLAPALPAQSSPHSPSLPHIVEKDGRYALFVDGAPYLMLGAQVNNSSAWPASMAQVWPTVERMGINTLEAPIYWEQFEPQRGHFDPSVLHTLLAQARQHHVHLVLLWFGTWKNGSDHYTPPFFKLNEAEVPHVVDAQGRKIDSPAAYSQFGLDADRAAFTELMRELKAADPQHTVLMVQVENEAGTWGSVRDFSPAAQKLFNSPVPQTLLSALHKQPGTWPEVFGKDADEFFQGYEIAHYINQVAEAGKAVYPLPLYINVATRDPFHHPLGSYESGNATDNLIPLWKATATAIDVFGPDLYTPDYAVYTTLLDTYHRPDNPMFVPETGNAAVYARYLFAALGHQAIGWSPFGMDSTGYANAPLGAARIDDALVDTFALGYHIFGPMQDVIARLNFEGKLQAVSEDPGVHSQTLDFGAWKATVAYGLGQFGSGQPPPGNNPVDGGAMVAQLGPNEFLITGVHCRVDLAPTGAGLQKMFVKVEEGYYKAGVWHALRIWNGDQTDYGLNFTHLPQVLRVTVATY